MFLSYRYRMYPNRAQRGALDLMLEAHRQLYNAALQERRDAWKRCRISVSYNDQAGQLKDIRAFDEGIARLNYSSAQHTLRRLDKAFRGFFRRIKAGERPGYPRFKGAKRFRSIRYTYGDGLRLRRGRLYVQNVGEVRIFYHRPIPDAAAITAGVLTRDGLGRWYVVLQVETAGAQRQHRGGPAVGIDMGLEYFAVLSTGEAVQNPRWFRRSEDRLAILQRRRARSRRGSLRRRRLTLRVVGLHNRIANQRRDFHHKLSARLVDAYGFIAIEDLNVAGLCRSHVSKSMGDAGWRQFLRMLEYKAERAGIQLVKVSANGTSQICSRCGNIVLKALSERHHNCPHCGFTAPRDVNAALNILSRGKARTGPPRKGLLATGGVAGSCPV